MRTETRLEDVEAARAACHGQLAGLVFRLAEIEADGAYALSRLGLWCTSPMGELSGCRASDTLCSGCNDACTTLRERLRILEGLRQRTRLKITVDMGRDHLGQLAWFARRLRRGRTDTWRTEEARRHTAAYSQFATPGCAAIVPRFIGDHR